MTALLDTTPAHRSPVEIARSLRERIADWSDAGAVAGAAADLLRGELGRPRVSIYSRHPVSGDLVMMAAAVGAEARPPPGSRHHPDGGAIDRALESGVTTRLDNYYVAPDFALSLPGETRSALAIPLHAGAALIGIVHLDYPSPHVPSAADLELAELVSLHVVTAWAGVAGSPWSHGAGSNGPAGTSDGRRDHVDALASVASAMAKGDDASATFAMIVETAARELGCESVALLTRHGSRQMLEVMAGTGRLRLPDRALVPIDGTRVGQVFRSGRPVELAAMSVSADPVLPREMLAADPRDGMIVPITAGGKISGVLVAIDTAGRAGFSGDDARTLQTLADLAGSADALRSIPRLRQRISDASMVAEVGRAMTGTLGLDDVLSIIVQAAELLVGGKCATVGLVADDRSSVTLAATSGSLRGAVGREIPMRDSILGWVASAAECVVTDSLGTDPRGWPLGEQFGAAAIVPLESRAQIRGVLLVARAPGASSPSDEDLDALRKLGAYAAIAIDNARLYREQTDLTRTLREQARELEEANAEVRDSQERLLVAEKMAALGRLTAGIAHEINSPLGSILNCLQLATTYAEEYREGVDDPQLTPDDNRAIAKDLIESLALAEESTRRVAGFVRTIKGQTRMEEDRIIAFEPAEVIESTIVLLAHEIGAGTVEVRTDLEAGLSLRGDPNKFAVIVQNLLSNAIDAYEGSEGIVDVSMRRVENAFLLEFSDQGAGIPEEIRPRIYDYLFTTKDIGHGTGLGLSLVHSIVTSHFRGTIDFSTAIGSGTTFTVSIPFPVGS